MEADYTKRELDMKFQKLEEKIDELHVETMDKIGESDRRNHDRQDVIITLVTEAKNGITKTNGSVARAFEEIQRLKTWRAAQVASLAVVTGLGMILIGMAAYIFTSNAQTINDRMDRIGQAIIRLQGTK